jgi:hypothetical protein
MAVKAKKQGGSGKWVAIAALGLAGFLGVETGWVGFGWAQLRSTVFPHDEALLSWLPGDTSAVVIVDPHQLKLKELGGESGAPRSALTRLRDDVKNVTGIDLELDVDKLVLSGSLTVARGRFSHKKLAERLAGHSYKTAEHEGATYLVRPGEDAIAVMDDSVLLYGDESAVQAGIAAHQRGTSAEKNEALTTRLRAIGWDHAVVGSVKITDEKPSVRDALTGSTGPRAVSVAFTTPVGMNLDAQVESASPGAADELAKLLEEKRKAGGQLVPFASPEAGKVLAEVASKATIKADPGSPMVQIHAHLTPAQLDTLVKEAKSSAPLGEIYKNVRLFQLLVPRP